DEPMREWMWSEIPVAFRAGLRLIARDEDAMSELLASLGSPQRRDVGLVARARRLLDDHDVRPSIEALAGEMNVHPVHLARQFRQAYGVSLREYRTIQMVKRAAAAIV